MKNKIILTGLSAMASLLLSAQEPERVEKHSFETDNLADKPWGKEWFMAWFQGA